MAQQRTPGISAFLHLLHETPEFTGLADFHSRHARLLPNVRTIYRWQRRARITHYPNVRFRHLGLVHCHVIGPREMSPGDFAIRARLLRSGLGAKLLYVECLVPEPALTSFQRAVHAAGGTLWVTDDPWQELPGSRRTMSSTPEYDPLERPHETFPLVIPVAIEAQSGQSLEHVWRTIHHRLGDRVWQYLPRGVRRLPHNGKRYVRTALTHLSTAGLIRQNTVRQSPDALEILVLATLNRDERAEWIARLAGSATIDLYDGPVTILRIHAQLATIKELLALTDHNPAHLYLLTGEIPTTYRYEYFNPTSRSWDLR